MKPSETTLPSKQLYIERLEALQGRRTVIAKNVTDSFQEIHTAVQHLQTLALTHIYEARVGEAEAEKLSKQVAGMVDQCVLEIKRAQGEAFLTAEGKNIDERTARASKDPNVLFLQTLRIEWEELAVECIHEVNLWAAEAKRTKELLIACSKQANEELQDRLTDGVAKSLSGRMDVNLGVDVDTDLEPGVQGS